MGQHMICNAGPLYSDMYAVFDDAKNPNKLSPPEIGMLVGGELHVW